MNIIDKLKDNDIIITEQKLILLKMLNEASGFFDVKIMSKKEFIDHYYFTYDEKAIYYLMDKYNLKEDIALVYLDNLYYIEDKDYQNDKLNALVNIKNELIKNNLLIFDDLFVVNDHRIVFYNYNSFNKFDKAMIENLKKETEVLIIEKEYKKYDPVVYEFDNIFEEVSFVATEIVKLIEKGINPNNIKLANIDSDYKDVIKFIFDLYNIKTDINDNYLISNKLAQDFLKNSGSIEQRIESLPKNSILDKIISVVNKYIIFDNENIVNEMIVNDFKKVKIDEDLYTNLIEVIDFKTYPIDDEYVFLLGFNQNIIPKLYKDEDYITDNEKDDLLIDKTVDKNKREKENVIKNILNIKNLVITYKNSTPFGVFFPSNLINDLNFNVIKGFKEKDIYSKDYANILYAKELDNYTLYGSISPFLKKYKSTLDIPYNKYDNTFKGIDNNKFLEKIKDGFNLSYSSMNNYYKCAFKYYLSNVLKVDIYEETFDTYIGSLFHYVLEKGLLSDKSVSDLVNEFVSNSEKKLDAKEEFFVNNIIPDIDFALDTIKESLNYTDLKSILFEEKVEVIKNDKVTVTFKGFMDKVMYEKFNNQTIVVIVDYKTGNTDIDLKYVPFGLSMQLPVYLYLAKNMKTIENIKFGGFYLQRVLNSKPVIDLNKSSFDKKREGLLLSGYSNCDKNILEKVDKTFDNSKIIKSMKLKKNGDFSGYAKVLSDCEIDKLIDITDKKIDESILHICEGEFYINPKTVENENLGCKYCKYKDICFMTKKDEVLISPDKDLSFLGGDIDA